MSISTSKVRASVICLHICFTGFILCSLEMRALQERLLGNYSAHVRPVLIEKDVLEINVSMRLMHVLGLDLKAQSLKSSGFMDVTWRDQYLGWNPGDFANITGIYIPQTLIWLPDLVIQNDVRGVKFFGDDRTQVQVRHDGTVTWQPAFLTETSCKADIYKYPFDTQECSLEIISWMTTSDKALVSFPTFLTSKVVVNGEFLLMESRVKREQFDVTFNQAYFEQGTFTVVLKRRYNFYLLSTVIPLAAFSMLSPLALLVPADSGEKITLSVTILLANLVFMGSLSDSIPRVADSISVFVLYTSLQILLSFASVSFNVGALYLSHMPTGTEKEDGNRSDKSDGMDGNFLCRNLRLVYRKIVSPASNDALFQNTVIPAKHNKVATVYTSEGKFVFSNTAHHDTPGSKPPSSPEAQRAGRSKSAPIGRRDRLCFLAFFIAVFSVNFVTILILAT